MRLIIAGDSADFARQTVDLICQAVQSKADLVIALPSGKTPLAAYEELALRVDHNELDVGGLAAFAIDELYGVPRDHPATNSSYFARGVFRRVGLVVDVMDSSAKDGDDECERFTHRIVDAGGIDLAVLGIGVNGHLAFNEPGSPFDSRARRVGLEPSTREQYIEAFGSFEATPAFGQTLGLADLMGARRVLLLASGSSKAKAVAAALEAPASENVPASIVQRHPDVTVILDVDAASLLKEDYSAE